MFRFWLFVHIAGVLGFVAAHGVSAIVALRLRREREPARVRAMLELSASTRRLMYVSLLLLLVGGVANAFVAHLWGEGWIWLSLGLLVGLTATTVPVLVRFYGRVREAAGRGDEAALAALLPSTLPIVTAVVGAVVILGILWMMIYRPF